MEQVLVRAARVWRKVAGERTALERAVKRRYRDAVRVERGPRAVQYSNQHAVVIQSKEGAEPKRGVYLRGGCDLPSFFLTAPFIKDTIEEGSIAIARPTSGVGTSQTAQVLQAIEGVPRSAVEDTCRRLEIKPTFVQATLLEENFEVPTMERFGPYPKNVVVISVGSDLTRSLHRHREHGFLIDIGGWWLNQSLDKAIKDVDTVRWFKKNFESVGRISVDDFAANLARIVQLLRESIGAEPIVYNTLVVEPGTPHHNYQLLAVDHFTRRREFNVALAEVSRGLGFHMVDVDRVLKENGIRDQVDFAHFPAEAKLPVAREAFRILRELEIV